MTKHCGHTTWWGISAWTGLGLILFLFFPELASAQSFTSIVDIPGISEDAEVTENFGLYINALYIFAITVGAMLAVLKLIAAGVKYMFSDIVTNKEAAKNDIKGALLGLLIVIGAVVILNTVNTDLTRVDLTFAPVNVDTRDYMREALRRIQDSISACTREVGCIIYTGISEAQCEAEGGQHIDGNILRGLSGYGGGNYLNRCLVHLDEDDEDRERIICEGQGREWDEQNQTCLSPDARTETISCGRAVASPICQNADTHPLCEGVDRGVRINIFDCTSAIEQCTSDGGTTTTPPGEIRNTSQISCIYTN